ncbi:MAG: T9SS type A sorting domain-containing protein [Chitinophagales bacterium]|nr:T9SS type A sorting domain-containing protein [Chitinophagales bacterium]
MKIRLLALFVFCAVAIAHSAETLTLNYQNTERNFIVHLPTGYTAGQQLPLVINMHGYTSNASQQELYSKMDQTANANNFIVCYPNGIANAWNSGFTPPYNSSPDDVGFISKVIDTLSTLYGVNLNRVYACGMSNGGFQSHRLACDLENRIAAIASVTGTISELAAFNCTLSRKVPVLHIHGTQDMVVSYNGSTGIKSVDSTISFWLDKNGCSTVSDVVNYPNTNTSDGSTVQRTRYTDCTSNTEVVLYKITGGGHTWPNALIDVPTSGPTNRDFDASQEIWDFFNRYTLSGPTGVPQIESPAIALNVLPNPTSGTMQVTVSGTNAYQYLTLTLVDITGRVVLTESNVAATTTLNISAMANGIYFLQLQGEGVALTQKIVKQ